ncbi:MAG: penicillin-binding transpeptidase domain-containing protein, partial [Gammaproteobacteria bacterium]
RGGSRRGMGNPAFMTLVKRQLRQEYSADDLNEAGLNVFTTLDLDLQEHAEIAVEEALVRIESGGRRDGLQAAVVVVDPSSGEILGLIGDRSPTFSGFNRALDARRPIGSVIKPFVYAYALSQPDKYALFSPLADEAITYTDDEGNVWEPSNFDEREHGQVSLLEALTRSYNLATVNLALDLKLERIRDYLQSLGFREGLPAYPSLVLGAVEMTPMELTALFSALANDGYQVPLRAISNVTSRDGRKLKRYGLQLRSVMDPETAALIRFALSRVVSQGTARAVSLALPEVQPLAGKTGTSNDNRDSWFAGFGANRLGVVWVGRDDNGMTGLTGSSGALPVWNAVIKGAGIAPLAQRLPEGLSWEWVDLGQGVGVPARCPNGERIPVHRRTFLQHVEHCEALPPPAGRGGVIDRLKEFFRP